MKTKIVSQFRTAKAAVLSASAVVAIFAASSTQATTLLGNPYSPAGASYSLTSVQGVNSANPNGSKGSSQVNSDFEFKGTLGVSYSNAKGGLTDFGLGLYQDGAKATQSTGLNLNFNQLTLASSVSITLADFDLKSDATFFNPNKVEPSILIYDANHNVYGSANPTQIWSALTNVPGQTSEDYWRLDFSKLLTNIGKADTNISGFLLYADAANGERASSDPYFLVAVGGSIPAVPEPATYLSGLALVALVLAAHAKAVLKKSKATTLV